ncbi:MAG: GTPase, partial [Candidatus Peribacteraceae bacterium]
MPRIPVVAIIGRPNTGKSTLFNRLIGQRKAIVSTIPGTTRDHVSHRIDADDVSYLLLDTGGIGATRDKDFERDVAGQSLLALTQADLILFTVNAKEPVTLDDRRVLDLLRKKRKRHVPVITVLTKADNPATVDEVLADFQEMNIGEEFLAVSAVHRLGIEELERVIDRELKRLGFASEAQSSKLKAQSSPRIAIVGRPNVGKSSIINALMSAAQRTKSPLLVSTIAGTTRDAVDTEIRYHDRTFILVDTAGLKKRSQTTEELERFSMF